jgi:hypothetical protein
MFLKDISKVRSKTYIFTFKPMKAEDDIFLDGIKKVVKNINKEVKDKKFQLRLSYTPSKPLARFAWKYSGQPGGKRKIKLEDAETVDVYVHRKVTK